MHSLDEVSYSNGFDLDSMNVPLAGVQPNHLESDSNSRIR